MPLSLCWQLYAYYRSSIDTLEYDSFLYPENQQGQVRFLKASWFSCFIVFQHISFCKNVCFKYVYVYACVCEAVHVQTEFLGARRRHWNPRGWIIGGCKLPDVCTGNVTWVISRNNTFLTTEQSCQPLWVHFFNSSTISHLQFESSMWWNWVTEVCLFTFKVYTFISFIKALLLWNTICLKVSETGKWMSLWKIGRHGIFSFQSSFTILNNFTFLGSLAHPYLVSIILAYGVVVVDADKIYEFLWEIEWYQVEIFSFPLARMSTRGNT